MNPDPDPYFSEYENLEIHDIMLKDRPRQEAYCKAILSNKIYFKDRIVLDVGAGTGILSAFCAKAGAKMVFAVEATNLAKIALDVIEENGLTSVVKVIHSKIEDFILPASLGKVDIIVSEWMGFYLLHEGMLDSLIYARDVFLREDGLMFPEEATLHLAPCSVPNFHKYYEDVDGIKMTSFSKKLRAQKSSKPEICTIREEDMLTPGNVIHYMNLMEVTLEDIKEIKYADSVVVETPGRFEGFCIWFEVMFPSEKLNEGVCLMTGPDNPETHWKQCIIVLPEESCYDVEKDEPISFAISINRSEINPRRYDMEVTVRDSNNIDHPVPCNCHMTKCILIKAYLDRLNAGQMIVDGADSLEEMEDNEDVHNEEEEGEQEDNND